MSFLEIQPLKHLILYFYTVKVLQSGKSKTTAGNSRFSDQSFGKFKEFTTLVGQNSPSLENSLPRSPPPRLSLL
jgi:hypothetical protein